MKVFTSALSHVDEPAFKDLRGQCDSTGARVPRGVSETQKSLQSSDRGMGRGFELAITPVFFGGIGWIVDRLAGTSPLFTLGLAIFGVGGIMLKMWLGYDRQMKAEEAKMGLRTGGHS